MLRVIPQRNADAAKGYYSQADYYAAGLDATTIWVGRGAAMLGLTGHVAKADFDHLCDNCDPRTGKPLTPRTRTDRTVLYDFNVHVPKSLSVLIERTDDPRLLDAVRHAGDAMMREVEAEMQTRVRKDGEDANRATGNAVYATILHRTSRPSNLDGMPDPHTHLHITVFNATYDGCEHQWKAGQFRDLVRDSPYWQAVFHAKLTAELAEMGFGVTRTKTGWEVAGVPDSVTAKFSRRTGEIEQLARDLGITDPVAKGKLGATSRRAKSTGALADLRQYWTDRLTEPERHALDSVVAEAKTGDSVQPSTTVEAAVRHAVLHSFERASVVPEKRLVAEALTFGVGGITPDQVRNEMKRQGVITRSYEGRLVATTPEVLREEERMLAFARDGRGRCAPLVPNPVIRNPQLNADQRAAVRHVLTGTDRVMIVRGAADTGKTVLTREAATALEAAGFAVLAIAPSADASRGTLRSEGFETADTVARFLENSDYREQARNGVVWVDEAGLLGAPTMAKLFDAAKELNARVVLVGDSKQHAAVERGAALRVLETHAGVPVARVRQILRQQGAYKAAVELLAEGRTSERFRALDELGWVRELPDGDRERAVADEYVAARRAGEDVLVVSPTHAEGNQITAAIRQQLKGQGELRDERTVLQLVPANWTEAQRADAVNYSAGDVLQFVRSAPGHQAGSRVTVCVGAGAVPLDQAARVQAYHTAQLAVAIGDRVRITANGWTRDRKHRLDNGATYTVAGFTDRGDIRFDNGWIVATDFGHLAHGYVSTSHRSQGRTVDRVLIAQSAQSLPANSREQFYVSVSRGRRSVTVFTDDKPALADAVTRTDPRISATELLPKSEPIPAAKSQTLWPHRSAFARLGDCVLHQQRYAITDWTRQQQQSTPQSQHIQGYAR